MLKKLLSCLALLCFCALSAEAQETKPIAAENLPRFHFVASGQSFDNSSNIHYESATITDTLPTRPSFHATDETRLETAPPGIQLNATLNAAFMRRSFQQLAASQQEKLNGSSSDFEARRFDFQPDNASQQPVRNNSTEGGFRWKSAIQQSLLFLAVQHGYAMTQPKTRRDLKGEFFHDYIESIKSLHGWDDGGRFFTNYIAHPMQGALTGYIQVQNDPRGINQRFGKDKDYWMSRLRAMAWSAAWSAQFEIGPISQASIGNVGLHGKQTWEDIVTTPTVGTVLLITEDALDRYLIRAIEDRTNNFYVRIFSRMLFNPVRNFSNMLRFKKPWYRDAGHFRD